MREIEIEVINSRLETLDRMVTFNLNSHQQVTFDKILTCSIVVNNSCQTLTIATTGAFKKILDETMATITDYVKAWLRWPAIWWFFTTFALPLSVPVILIHYLNYYKFQVLKKKLEGKVVLITGASSGLGEALAHSFYKVGCKVILCSRRENELDRVRNSLLQMYKNSPTYPPVILPMDISNIDTVSSQAKRAVSIYGQIDILINNAGISYRGSILNTKFDVDNKLMDVNYFGPVALIKEILPSMVDHNEGHIVGISSVQGLIGIPHRSAYAASKHALQAFHDCLRAEVAHHNIKVSVVSPGYVKTNLSINALTGDGRQYGVMDETTLKGQDPSKLADKILKALVEKKDELIVASFVTKAAIIFRHLFPSIYFWVMEHRASKVTLMD